MVHSFVNISISGKPYSVPQGMTAIQAMWYCGFDLTHGVGCLGGVCGACTITFKINNAPVKTALGCQTVVLDGMNFNFYQPEVKKSVPYQTALDPEKPMEVPAIKAHFNETLASTRRCVSCGACTIVCPQEIDAMKGVKEAINSNFKAVSDLFLNCVMCGFCASVCEVHVAPHLVGLYSRKVTSLYLTTKNGQLRKRVEEIKEGKFEEEWNQLFKLIDLDPVRLG